MIAGIDLSTRAIDICLIHEDDGRFLEHQHFPLPNRGDAFDRARWVRDAMPYKSSWLDHGIVAFGIEDPRGYGAGPIYRVQGAVLACLPETILVHPLVPSQWRKLVGLKGNSGKDEVAFHAVNDGTPDEFRDWTQDQCDAYCIAQATRELLETKSIAA